MSDNLGEIKETSGTIRLVLEAIASISLSIAAFYGNTEANTQKDNYLEVVKEYQQQIVDCYKGCK